MPSRLTQLLPVVLLVAACGGAAAGGTATTTAPSTTTTSITTSTTTSAPTTTTTTPTTSTASTTTTTLPSFPPDTEELTHGGTVWAVILAGADELDDPVLEGAVEVAADAGYTAYPTDCDVGAPEALGLDDSAATVSVYFATEAAAEEARAAFEARGIGVTVAEVQTYCLD